MPVRPEHGEVTQDSSAATQGQRLGKGCGERFLCEIGAAQLEVAGPSLLGQAGTVEAEPAAVVGVSAVEGMHFLSFPGLMRDPRKIRQDFSHAMPRSTGARAADRARLKVCSVTVSSPPGGRHSAVVPQSPAPT